MLQEMTPLDVVTLVALFELVVIFALLIGGRRALVRLIRHVMALVEVDQDYPLAAWLDEVERVVRAALPLWARVLIGPARLLVHWAWHELEAEEPGHANALQHCPYAGKLVAPGQPKGTRKRRNKAPGAPEGGTDG